MKPQELVAHFQPWRERHRRRAFAPEFGEGSPRSRFGGTPDMPVDASWPVCSSCEEKMLFVFQLDLAASPGDLGEGLVQLFYCPTDDGDCDTFMPFAGANEARWVQALAVPRELSAGTPVLTHRSIVGWKEFWDHPDPEEHTSLGLTYDYDFQARTVRIACPEIGWRNWQRSEGWRLRKNASAEK